MLWRWSSGWPGGSCNTPDLLRVEAIVEVLSKKAAPDGAAFSRRVLGGASVDVAPHLALGGIEHAGEDHQDDKHPDAGLLARLQPRPRVPPQEEGDVPGQLVAGARPAVGVETGSTAGW